MTRTHALSGAARDAVRSGLLTTLRLTNTFTGRMLNPAMIDDPYPTYDWLRERGRLAGTRFGLASVDHALCDGILRNPAVHAGAGQRARTLAQGSRLQRWLFGLPSREGLVDPVGTESMLGMDGPGHTRLRRLARGPFTRAAVEELRPRVSAVADDLLHRARQRSTFDLMGDFAKRLPVTVICDLLGIPEADRPRFQVWGTAIATDLDAITPASQQQEATEALREMQDYFTGFLARRRSEPAPGMLSDLLHADGPDRLDDREVLVLACLLVLAGFETTVNLIGNGVAALIDHPEQQALLRADPELVPGAVEELLRFDAPVQMVSRVCTEPIEVDGVTVPEGVPLSLMLGGANRDPQVFERPDRLEVTRPNAAAHLAFATGPHHCLGAHLARLEGEVAFRALLDQLGDLRPAGPRQRRRTFVMRGYRHLPLYA